MGLARDSQLASILLWRFSALKMMLCNVNLNIGSLQNGLKDCVGTYGVHDQGKNGKSNGKNMEHEMDTGLI